jgi:hypothetical protein
MIFPGKSKYNRQVDLIFIHSVYQVFSSHKPGFWGIIDQFKGRFIMEKFFPVLANIFWENMGMKVDDHLLPPNF